MTIDPGLRFNHTTTVVFRSTDAMDMRSIALASTTIKRMLFIQQVCSRDNRTAA